MGWGEAEITGHEEEDIPGAGHIHLANGHRLVLSKDRFIALLHTQQVVDAVTQRAESICDLANELVAMDPRAVVRLGKGEPAYKISVQNRSDTTRARARVYPNNMLGALDHHHNGTLDKAREAFPSDPIPEGIGPEVDSETPNNSHFGPEHESESGELLHDVEGDL